MSKLFVAIPVGLLLSCCVPRPASAQQSSNQSPIRSPRLVALEKQLKSGDVAALDNFWSGVKQQGAPMVEPIPGDDKHVLVTFLWRGGTETKNVVLFSALPGVGDASSAFSAAQLVQNQLVNLPGTNVWFKTYTVRKDGRFSYYFSPNDSLLPSDQRKDKDWDTLQPDPLNPHRYLIHEEQRGWIQSVVELPGAAPAPWLETRPDVAKGRTEVFRLTSKILGNERRFWVYTPPGYKTEGKSYPLLVLFDGLDATSATIIENLLAENRIHPLVVVMVDQKDRILELGCYEPFNEFLVRELIPWVREHYDVSSNPAEMIVGGQSRGGLAAAFAGLRHPEVFGNVLSESGYLSWDPREDLTTDEEDLEFEWIIRQFAASPILPLRFTLTVGLFERDHEFPDSPSLLQANRHMRDVLLAKGYPVNYREVPGGHEVYAFEVALPDELVSLVGTRTPDKEAAAH